MTKSSFHDNCAKNSMKNACGTGSETRVSCKAEHCVYNKNNACCAEHIGIGGKNATDVAQTECTSFRNK